MAKTASKTPSASKSRIAKSAAKTPSARKGKVIADDDEVEVCDDAVEVDDEALLDDTAEDDELNEVEASDEQESTTEADELVTTAAEKRFAVGTGTVNRKELDATRLYLREIEYSPLLTAEEEVYYYVCHARVWNLHAKR